MLKQGIALIALSAAIVLSMSYGQQAVQLLLNAHDWVSQSLTTIFSGDHAGNIARNLIALLTIPLVVGLVPTMLYWAVRRHFFPYFMEIVWVVWLVQAGALLIMYQTVETAGA